MNCSKARRRLPDSLDGSLKAAEQSALGAHLEACAGCRQEKRALAATRGLLFRHGAVPIPADLTYLAARVAQRRRPAPLLWMRRGLAAATMTAALAAFAWQWHSAFDPSPGPAPTGVRVREVAEAEELHQAFVVQQSLDERDGLLLFAPKWAERGP